MRWPWRQSGCSAVEMGGREDGWKEGRSAWVVQYFRASRVQIQILGVRLVRCFPGRSRTSPKGTTTSAPACRWGPRWGHPGPTCERAPPTPPPPRSAILPAVPSEAGGTRSWSRPIFFHLSIGHFIDVSRFTVPKGPRKGHFEIAEQARRGQARRRFLSTGKRAQFSRGDSHSRRRETQARGRGWPG